MSNDNSFFNHYIEYDKEDLLAEELIFQDNYSDIDENNKVSFLNDSFNLSDFDIDNSVFKELKYEKELNFDIDDFVFGGSKFEKESNFDNDNSIFKESKSDINNHNKNLKENQDLSDKEILHFYQKTSINYKSIREKGKNITEKENLYKRYIIEDNISLPNLEKHDNKVMSQSLSNYFPLNENDYYSNNINKDSFNLNKTQILNYSQQISFPNYKNNETNFSSKSKIDDSLPFYRKTIDNFDLSFSNKKRIRIKTEVPNIKINFKNIPEFLPNKNINIDKNFIFRVDKKSNIGRKKKNSGETGKHDKFSKDNLRSKVKSLSLNFLYEYFNKEIQKIDINDLNKSAEWRLYKIKTVDNKIKVYNLELLNQTLKSIFSTPISGRADKKENHNKDLIDKIYKINQEGNSEKTKK